MTPAPPATPTERLFTAEEYAALPDDGRLTELVRGRIVEMPSPKLSHGYVCGNAYWALRSYAQPRDIGRIVTNDSGVITERGPDTMRGPDVAFYSYARVPKGPLPAGYWPAPELVIEVRSDSDRWSEINAKAGEYLKAGVLAVCVLDPETESVGVYTANEFPRRLTGEEELTLPEVFPDFRVRVRDLFA